LGTPPSPVSLGITFFHRTGLAEAADPLSAARLPGMPAAVLPVPQFQPVVAKEQFHLGGPGQGRLQIG